MPINDLDRSMNFMPLERSSKSDVLKDVMTTIHLHEGRPIITTEPTGGYCGPRDEINVQITNRLDDSNNPVHR